jgi:hypothetical protein
MSFFINLFKNSKWIFKDLNNYRIFTFNNVNVSQQDLSTSNMNIWEKNRDREKFSKEYKQKYILTLE